MDARRKASISWVDNKSRKKRQVPAYGGDLRKTEELVWEVIDLLICFDPSCFDTRGDLSIIKRTIRRVIALSLFNRGLVVSMYKELSGYMRHKYYRYQTDQEPELAPENVFREFLRLSYFSTWTDDHEHFERLAPFLSTRHFIPGDAKASTKSLEDFRKVSTTPFPVEPGLLSEAHAIAHALGAELSKRVHFPYKTHVSFKTAGSYDTAASNGGRAQEIKNYLSGVLRRECEQNVDGISWGSSRYEEESRQYLDYDGDQWCGIYTRVGLDSLVGTRALRGALVAAENHSGPIPVKVITVSEPGYKARIVTTTKWWVNLVQQPVGHMLVESLSKVPELCSGLSRTDQAWQVARSLSLRSNGPFPHEMDVLSSDLTSATDAIPRELASRLFQGFCEGIGFKKSNERLYSVCSKILSSKRIVTCAIGEFETIRGVPMGEPLTKGILALFTYVAFRRSYLRYENKYGLFRDGYFFTAGGDDHLAIGPPEFLSGITETLVSMGAILSSTKHGSSRLAVTYCEKTLLVKNITNKLSIRDINGLGYEKSIMIDSVKVRLLSPSSKSNELFDNVNCAIGKGKSLGRTLRWMIHRDSDVRRIGLIRSWFLFRMGDKIPLRSKIFWHLMLPEWCGGLGLSTEADYERIGQRLPLASKVMIREALRGDRRLVRMFSKLLSNSSIRGIELTPKLTSMQEKIRDMVLALPPLSWSERFTVVDCDPNSPPTVVYRELNKQGYYLVDDAVDWIMRPVVAQEMFLAKNPWSPFKQVSIKKRYAIMWDKAIPSPIEEFDLTVEEVKNFLALEEDGALFNISVLQANPIYRSKMPSMDVTI
jgi:hypothetical protein